MRRFEDTYQLIAYEIRASLFRYTFMNDDMSQFSYCGKDLTNYIGMLIIYSK